MQVYKIKLRDLGTSPYMVVAYDPTSAYNKVLKYIEDKNHHVRYIELASIEVVADSSESKMNPCKLIT